MPGPPCRRPARSAGLGGGLAGGVLPAEDEVGHAAAERGQLAFPLQPGPPGAAQVLVVAGHAEADAGHPLAGLHVPVVQVGDGMALRSPHPAEDLKGIVRLASHRHYLSGTGARLPFTVGAAGGHGEFRLRNLLSATLPPNRFQRYRLTWAVPG